MGHALSLIYPSNQPSEESSNQPSEESSNQPSEESSNDLLSLPPSVNLRIRFGLPPVYNQGQSGDCTANAWAGLYAIESIVKSVDPNFQPSRLFIYFTERALHGKPIGDHGANLSDGLETLSTLGVCSEKDWPYDLSKVDQKPPPNCYQQALDYRIIQGHALAQDLTQMKTCLNRNHPFVFGFTVYSNFHESDFSNGVMLMPTPQSTPVGRHAIVAVGYNDLIQAILCRNSWGEDWGMQGYFWMPYLFISNSEYAREFYHVESITK